MAISDDFTVNYTQRRIYHSSGTTVYSMNELYSWLMNVFDESGTIDDTIPMTAQTPTAYTLTNGWFLDYVNNVSHEFLNGGSLKTIGWDAGTYSYGIRKKAYNASGAGTPFGSGDIGLTITETDSGDTGIILAYDESLGTEQGYVWIRPDALTDTFQDVNSAYTVATSSAAGSFTAASTTGETIWANPFTLGTIASNTQLYLYQADVEISTWWSTGHIDILTLVKELGYLIDRGYVTFFARQYTKLYDHYLSDLSGGSRTPIPLATFSDSNNPTGYRQMVLTDATGSFTVGEVIEDDSDATIQGIVTSSSGPVPDITIGYYLFNSTQTDFSGSSGAFTGLTSTSQATATAPTNIGPAGYSGITFTFGNTSQNLNNGNGLRPYDCIIDANDYPLDELYEYLKYVTRYSSITSLNGHTGEDYVSVGDIRLPYDGQTGDFTEMLTVTGGNSGATGIIVSDHENGASGTLVLRDVSGTFIDNEQITDTSSGVADVDLSLALDEIAPTKQSPFGTFAGGKFFGARGVWLTNYLTSDANNFELIDSTGTRQEPPTLIAITVSGLEAGDRVSVFRTLGDNELIDRTYLQSHATNNISGLNTFEVDAATPIPTDTPNSGVIRLVDNSLNREIRYTYTSWSGNVFSGLSPNLTVTYDTTDTAYIPYLDQQATGASVSTNVIYTADRYVLTVVRMAGIQPFKVKGTVTINGLSVTAIRNPDIIYQ